MKCQTVRIKTRQVHVSPNDQAGHWRAVFSHYENCDRPAEVRVAVYYTDGQKVKKALCRACADEWRGQIARFPHTWTEEPIAEGIPMQVGKDCPQAYSCATGGRACPGNECWDAEVRMQKQGRASSPLPR